MSAAAVPRRATVCRPGAVGAIVIWDLTGNPLGAGSLGRQFMPVAITVRIGVLLTILRGGDALLPGRLGGLATSVQGRGLHN